jgi:hypothetical protein
LAKRRGCGEEQHKEQKEGKQAVAHGFLSFALGFPNLRIEKVKVGKPKVPKQKKPAPAFAKDRFVFKNLLPMKWPSPQVRRPFIKNAICNA